MKEKKKLLKFNFDNFKSKIVYINENLLSLMQISGFPLFYENPLKNCKFLGKIVNVLSIR